MTRIIKFSWLVAVGFLFTPVHAKQIKMSIDWAIFQYDEHQRFVEIYYSFLQSDLQYQQENAEFIGLTLGRLQVFKQDSLINNYAWKTQNVIQDLKELELDKNVIDRVGFPFPPGDYQLKLVLSDINNPSNADSASWKLTIEPISDADCNISDLELASSIRRVPQETESPFYKNTLLVEPNPSLIYNQKKPVLFFYAEVYNLPLNNLQQGYKINYFVSDVDDNPLDQLKSKTVQKRQAVDPSVEYGFLNVGRLPSGSYTLHVNVLDASDTRLASKSKKFYIYQPGDQIVKRQVPLDQAQYQRSVFAALDSAQIEEEYLKTSYLLDQEGKTIWASIPTLDGKRHFLYQFWNYRDPDPSTPKNENYEEYLRRINYANQNFNAFRLEGWRTDRGRVYMVYGPPSDVERHPNEPNYYPYEIWEYNELQNGVIFVFADLEGHRDYKLLHSNLVGEIIDYNYMDTIQKGY